MTTSGVIAIARGILLCAQNDAIVLCVIVSGIIAGGNDAANRSPAVADVYIRYDDVNASEFFTRVLLRITCFI